MQSRDPDAAQAVRRGLRETEDADVFVALATAVRVHGDGRFTGELLAALDGNRPGVRQAAAEALAALADPALVRRLRAAAADPGADPGARQAALWALGRSGRKQAAAALLEQLTGANEALRRAAADALADLSGRDYGLDAARWRAWWERHKDLSDERWLEARLAYQTSRARRLEGDLGRARAQVVRLHQQLYTRLPPAERLAYIQALPDQEDPVVRLLAVTWGLELLPASDAARQHALAEVLLRLSHDGASEVQRSAVLALGRVPQPAAFGRLRRLLHHGRPCVRAAAVRALALAARGAAADRARQRQVMDDLQKALDDCAVEVVVEAAEALGTLGAPEAGPVLLGLLRHASEHVRQTAAQALERVADAAVLDGLLEALDDPGVMIRFSLVGALGHAAGDGRSLPDRQRRRLLDRLEGLLARDADPGVRGRAASVLGECAPPALLEPLWKCVLTAENDRVQEKAWAAFVEVLARSDSLALLQEWDRSLTAAKQGPRRLQLLADVAARWRKRPPTRPAALAAQEMLVQAQLDHGKWAAAFPLVRELLARPATEAELTQRLRWLLAVGEQALREGNRDEARRAVREARPFLARNGQLADAFAKLAEQARQGESSRAP